MNGIERIPDDVLGFLDTYIRSVDQLEILLLLHTRSDRVWSARAVSDELRSNEDGAALRLEDLARHGLVAVAYENGRAFRYQLTGDRHALVARVAFTYQDFRLRMIERIFTKPDGLREFASAFRLRSVKGEK